MKTRTYIAPLVVALTAVFHPGVLPAARADMTTTMETRTFLPRGVVDISSKVRYARDHDERVEERAKLGGVSVDEITISLCKSNQQITLDEKSSIYYARPFKWRENFLAEEKAKSNAIAAMEFPADKTGSVIEVFQVTSLGEEVIAGVKSTGYLIKGRTEKTGCAKMPNEDESREYRTEYWFGERDKVLTCLEAEFEDAFNGEHLKEKRFEIENGCKISYETKGNLDEIGKHFGKLLMRTRMYQGDSVFYSEEITNISIEKIDDALFAVPSSAKKVGKSEYQNARSQALRQALQDAENARKKAAENNAE